MERIPKSGEFYKHFKDKLYQIITVAEHSEDGQKLVIYQALYGDFKTYARPLEMFISEVDHEKYPDVKQKYRFEKVEFACDEKTLQVTDTVEIMESAEVGSSKTYVVEEDGDMEAAIEPGLLAFLDTDDWDEKYNILVSLRDKMTDKLIDDFAVVMDVLIPEGKVEARYEQLKICVRTRQKYESQHLR